jgi:septal ring factor EnvC (AmiA/AmiB activator)
MTSRPYLVLAVCAAAICALAVGATAQQAIGGLGDISEARRSLGRAQADGQAARERARRLEVEAARVTEAAEKTAREAAAIAARIQEAEAEIAGHEARMRLIAQARRELAARLAERQQPLVRLTAALQRLSRRPPVLALLRPGSVRDTMYMRALLATMLPEVDRRTASLRVEIARGQELERRARLAAGQLRASESELRTRRESLLALESRQRLLSRQATGTADREAERALALAERARDLGALVDDLGRAGVLREELARLPGPIMRPARPEAALVAETEPPAAAPSPSGLPSYMLPVAGRLVTGFGDSPGGGPRSRGLSLATRPGAQAVAPAPGRVVFAGPYRGYGRIVIIEHPGGWTTLVTGLAQLDAEVGDRLVAGSPIGVAGARSPVVTVELRQDGEPVNPLQYIRTL